MKLKVIGSSEEIKKVMKTNRDYKTGSYVNCSEDMMMIMGTRYSSLFQLEGVEPKAAPEVKKESSKPSKNKLFSKGNSFKSKGE